MRRTPRPLSVLATVALISAGCGSNAPSETGTASSSGSGTGSANTAREKGMKFADCMRDNGVSAFPDPTPNAPLIDTTRIPSAAGRGARSIPGFTAATQKCGAEFSRELGLKGNE